MIERPEAIERIITTANELQQTGQTSASTGERIAAAFVMHRMDWLPPGYDPQEAWDRLGSWQRFVVMIWDNWMDEFG